MGTRKPRAARIRAANPLPSRDVTDPLACCNICMKPGQLTAWRAHDDHDHPLPGVAALVYVAKDHPGCMGAMKRHPRLYGEEAGLPGHFPALCGPCRFRKGMACQHAHLKANGGAGLVVKLTGGLPPGVRICPPPRIVRHATACDGREVIQ